jgi:uncharacterized membrane protein (DUF485 family)
MKRRRCWTRPHSRFQPNPPLLNVFRAFVVLAAFGSLWLSVRGQHPCTGPSGWAIAIAYVLVAVVIGWSAPALKRSGAGVTGPAQRARNIGIGVLLVGWTLVYVFQAVLYKAGAPHDIVYGLYPATAACTRPPRRSSSSAWPARPTRQDGKTGR